MFLRTSTMQFREGCSKNFHQTSKHFAAQRQKNFFIQNNFSNKFLLLKLFRWSLKFWLSQVCLDLIAKCLKWSENQTLQKDEFFLSCSCDHVGTLLKTLPIIFRQTSEIGCWFINFTKKVPTRKVSLDMDIGVSKTQPKTFRQMSEIVSKYIIFQNKNLIFFSGHVKNVFNNYAKSVRQRSKIFVQENRN